MSKNDPQKVRCIKEHWDGIMCIKYYPGDEAMIAPDADNAMYFEGWEVGTEIKVKERGKRVKKNGKIEITDPKFVTKKITKPVETPRMPSPSEQLALEQKKIKDEKKSLEAEREALEKEKAELAALKADNKESDKK
jgi:hypothetical protein